MKQLALILCALFAVISAAFAGSEVYSGKEMKETTEPCPKWYGDHEWQFAVWGTYAFSSDGEDDDDDNDNDASDIIGHDSFGGGIDAKYFFNRHLAVGIEGFGLSNDRDSDDFDGDDNGDDGDDDDDDSDFTGAVLGTFTLRWPIECSRFAPYVWGGIGGIFGGGDDDDDFIPDGDFDDDNEDDDAHLIGQIGLGFEIRFTQHIGMINDVSWNFTSDRNFGMVRSGISFAF